MSLINSMFRQKHAARVSPRRSSESLKIDSRPPDFRQCGLPAPSAMTERLDSTKNRDGVLHEHLRPSFNFRTDPLSSMFGDTKKCCDQPNEITPLYPERSARSDRDLSLEHSKIFRPRRGTRFARFLVGLPGR